MAASKQANKQAYMHREEPGYEATHFHNAVTLVWSLLRLAPISLK